jgi:hypothetical protein
VQNRLELKPARSYSPVFAEQPESIRTVNPLKFLSTIWATGHDYNTNCELVAQLVAQLVSQVSADSQVPRVGSTIAHLLGRLSSLRSAFVEQSGGLVPWTDWGHGFTYDMHRIIDMTTSMLDATARPGEFTSQADHECSLLSRMVQTAGVNLYAVTSTMLRLVAAELNENSPDYTTRFAERLLAASPSLSDWFTSTEIGLLLKEPSILEAFREAGDCRVFWPFSAVACRELWTATARATDTDPRVGLVGMVILTERGAFARQADTAARALTGPRSTGDALAVDPGSELTLSVDLEDQLRSCLAHHTAAELEQAVLSLVDECFDVHCRVVDELIAGMGTPDWLNSTWFTIRDDKAPDPATLLIEAIRRLTP